MVPHTMKKEILTQFHDSLLSGHLGCKKTYGKILQRFYWFDMKSDVTLHIKQCDVCAANKIPNKKPRAPLGSVKAGAPWDVVPTDYIGPVPVTKRGNIHSGADRYFQQICRSSCCTNSDRRDMCNQDSK